MKSEHLLYIVAVLIAIAALPLPYSYYVGVRFIACLAFAYVAFESYRLKAWPTMAIAFALSAIFNPFIPLHATKNLWAIVDLGSATYLAIVAPHISTRFHTFYRPDVSIGQVATMLVASAFASVFCMTLLALLLFLISLPAEWLGLNNPTRTLRYLYPGVGIAGAVGLLAGWAYKSGTRSTAA